MKGRWEDERTVKFVKLYRDHGLLWNCHDASYKNRKARVRALASIARAMKMANFGPADVSRKIKNLRSTYAQEVQKIVKSTRGPPEDIYTPAMPWFPIMDDIIRNIIVPGKVGPGMESSSSSNQMATTARAQYLAMGEMSDPSATPEILPVTQEMQLEFPVTVTPHSPKRHAINAELLYLIGRSFTPSSNLVSLFCSRGGGGEGYSEMSKDTIRLPGYYCPHLTCLRGVHPSDRRDNRHNSAHKGTADTTPPITKI
ncbi:hypothetical protein J6590_077031 [Homalodisca vitripennis]|nr:hypothetical protein J6590_077031 [Homalodisca vitripennis]